MNIFYCTNSITSFDIQPNKLFKTYEYLPKQIVEKKRRFLPNKKFTVGGGWIDSFLLRNGIPSDINEDTIFENYLVYDVSKVSDSLKDLAINNCIEDEGIDISQSEFVKYFNDFYGDKMFYYKPITDPFGIVTKIEVWEKGEWTLYTAQGNFWCYKYLEKEDLQCFVKEIARGIKDYKFFTEKNNVITFIDSESDIGEYIKGDN